MRVVLLLIAALLASAQPDPLADAVAAFQRGDLKSAERVLRAELTARPNNPDALGILGVVLDQQKRYDEAGKVYRKAVALTPRSAALLNNYGNHLLASGKPEQARDIFLKVLAINPSQANANAQLARFALERKAPAEALRYVERLPGDAQAGADVQLLRMQALYGLRRDEEADAILARLSAEAAGDSRRCYLLGTALSAAGEYAKAEELFSRAVAADPDNFDALYGLGLAASHAGHDERARDILQSARGKQPNNVDVLYDLAAVNARLGQREPAMSLLAEAARLAPKRADVQQLLARTAADLGDFGDSIQAWNRYLELVPGDDVARRERAFARTANGDDVAAALAELKAYVAKHPRDAVGRYELGLAEASDAPEDAVPQFARALELKPDLIDARVARGLLLLKQGEFAAALPDFEAAAKRESSNSVVLDRLGQTYMALDRPADAVPALRRAAELAPRDSKTLMHLGRALTQTGREQEAAEVFARFRELGPDRSALPRPAGLVDFLALSPAEQQARYRAGVERTVRRDPSNADAQVRYLKLLLEDGNTAGAAATARTILELKPSPPILAEAGDALLAAEQYAVAREFLEQASAIRPSGDFHFELAIATAHAVNPQAGLAVLEKVPDARRDGNYHLARAEMLESAGRSADAAASLDRALHANPTRAELYRYAAAYLIAKQRPADALALLDQGAKNLPDNPEIALLRCIALSAAGRPRDAAQSVATVRNRWPDWYKGWLAQAILMAWEGRRQDSDKALETAVALGAADGATRLAEAAKAPANASERASALLRALSP